MSIFTGIETKAREQAVCFVVHVCTCGSHSDILRKAVDSDVDCMHSASTKTCVCGWVGVGGCVDDSAHAACIYANCQGFAHVRAHHRRSREAGSSEARETEREHCAADSHKLESKKSRVLLQVQAKQQSHTLNSYQERQEGQG